MEGLPVNSYALLAHTKDFEVLRRFAKFVYLANAHTEDYGDLFGCVGALLVIVR